MPTQSCRSKGKAGYSWGEEGFCYVYTSGNEESRKRAKAKADKQGRAIKSQEGD